MLIDWWLNSLRFKQYYTLRNSAALSGNYKAKKSKKKEAIKKNQIKKKKNKSGKKYPSSSVISRQSVRTHTLVHIFLPAAVTQQNPQQFNF